MFDASGDESFTASFSKTFWNEESGGEEKFLLIEVDELKISY